MKSFETRLAAVSTNTGTAEAEAAKIVRDLAAFWRTGIAELQALPTPSGDSGVIAKLNADRNDVAADFDNLASAITDGNEQSIEAAKAALRATTASYDGLEQGYGLKVCGAAEG